MPESLTRARRLGAERTLRGAAVASVGMAVPGRIVTNEEVAANIDVDERWIRVRTGVHERRYAADEETLAEFGALAGERALASAGVDASDVDLVIVATSTPDEIFPTAAAMISRELGVGESAAIADVAVACTGFVSSMSLAAAQIEAGRSQTALVIGADLMSRITNRSDRGTAAIFADGAGAIVMRAVDGAGAVGPFVLGADTAQAELVRVPRDTGKIDMAGPDTFKHAVNRISESTLEAAGRAGVELADIDLFVYHQANSRILLAVGERIGLDQDRVVDCVASYGNTSAASIPIALAVAEAEGRLKPGSLVLVGAVGSGLTWGSVVCEWGIEAERDG